VDEKNTLQQLNEALQELWGDLKFSTSYIERVDPIDPRQAEIHFTFTFDEEDLADQLIRAARSKLASFGPEYWLSDSHVGAAQFRQDGHIAFKAHKSLILSHLYWGVSFILCAPGESYSLVEDSQA
jgi:hypothetical protein